MIRAILIILVSFLISSCNEGCTEFTGESFNNSVINVPANSSEMVDTGIHTKEGKLVRVRVARGGVFEEPRKYKVLVKADPRFENANNFILEYDPKTSSYITKWVDISQISGIPDKHAALLNDYNTRKIPVGNDDAINFTIISKEEFYRDSQLTEDIALTKISDFVYDPFSLAMSSGGADNIYINTSDVSALCALSQTTCNNKELIISSSLLGVSPFNSISNSVPICGPSSTGPCKMAEGLGMMIKIGQTLAKKPDVKFVPQNMAGEKGRLNYYLLSPSNGDINFEFDGPKLIFSKKDGAGQDPANSQFMKDLAPYANATEGSNLLIDNLEAVANIQRFIFGRYFLQVNVGSATGAASYEKINNVKAKYQIRSGSSIVQEGFLNNYMTEFNASRDGKLFVGVEQVPGISGSFVFSSQTFTGKNGFSSWMESFLVKPLRVQFLETAKILFGSLSRNAYVISAVYAAMTLYIMIYGFMFALGAVKFTAEDFLIRVGKILLLSILFSSSSWDFFHKYFFNFALNATDQIIRYATNATSTYGSMFGFIDPILEKYFSANLWHIIGIYILWFGHGYIFPAYFLIMGIFSFIRSLVSVIVGYIMAMLSITILIALAPIFISFILFERTRSYFENWLNILIGYIIQPIIVLVFVLFVDQILSELLSVGLRKVCYECVVDLSFTVNLPFDLTINMRPACISMRQPSPLGGFWDIIKLSLMFFSISKMCSKVVSVATDISDMIVGGSAGAPGGAKGGGAQSMAESIANTFIDKPISKMKFMVKNRVKAKIGFERKKDLIDETKESAFKLVDKAMKVKSAFQPAETIFRDAERELTVTQILKKKALEATDVAIDKAVKVKDALGDELYHRKTKGGASGELGGRLKNIILGDGSSGEGAGAASGADTGAPGGGSQSSKDEANKNLTGKNARSKVNAIGASVDGAQASGEATASGVSDQSGAGAGGSQEAADATNSGSGEGGAENSGSQNPKDSLEQSDDKNSDSSDDQKNKREKNPRKTSRRAIEGIENDGDI